MTVIAQRRADRALAQARNLGVAATITFGILFSAMWLPFYIARAEGQLFLYPLALLGAVLAMTLGGAGVALAARAVATPAAKDPTRRTALVWLALNAAMLVLPVPALWFGNVPVLILGG